MKKSEMYRETALAVMRDGLLPDGAKIDIIAELMSRESLERFFEEQAVKKEAEEQYAKDAHDGKVAMGA